MIARILYGIVFTVLTLLVLPIVMVLEIICAAQKKRDCPDCVTEVGCPDCAEAQATYLLIPWGDC